MDISKLDINFASLAFDDEGIEWISSHDKRVSVHGVFYDEKEGLYRRVPEDVVKASNNPALSVLSKMTSGGRVRFVTNSPFIAIKAALPASFPAPHMPITTTHGFTVYADGFFQARYSPVFQDFLNFKEEWNGEKIYFAQKKGTIKKTGNKLIEIYFPLYGGVCELNIGIETGSTIETAPPYQNEKPLVFYGSSITQGACVTRPGNDYVSLVARRLNSDYINLGFSGNGNAEEAMLEYFNSFDASLFAYDYNLYKSKKDVILPPHFSIYERIREKHPEAVILLYDKPGCDYAPYPEREQMIYETYQKAIALGDKKVCYIPTRDLLGEEDRDVCMTDGSHPSDFGAMRMTDAICSAVDKYFNE